MSIKSFTQPKDGRGQSLEMNHCDGLEYTPDPELCGESSCIRTKFISTMFTYTNQDADDQLTDTANVYVTVFVRPPVARNDGPVTTPEGVSVTIEVTENDNDPDGGNVKLKKLWINQLQGTVPLKS